MAETNTIHGRFGRRLREMRRDRGLSQSQLAEWAEITPEYVSRIERGLVGPSLMVVDRLAAALGSSPKSLFEFEVVASTDTVVERIHELAKRAPPDARRLLLRVAETLSGWGHTRKTRARGG
jgi:transcriptional regulator with XRE-family HTH domain